MAPMPSSDDTGVFRLTALETARFQRLAPRPTTRAMMRARTATIPEAIAVVDPELIAVPELSALLEPARTDLVVRPARRPGAVGLLALATLFGTVLGFGLGVWVSTSEPASDTAYADAR